MRGSYRAILYTALILSVPASSGAQRTTKVESLGPTGPGTLMEALEPSLRKWYIPQELYDLFGWEQWKTTNYAKFPYKRYRELAMEGFRYYDIYGNYITRGWEIYSWEEDQPRELGSGIFKSPRFSSMFDNLLISSTSKGQYYTALTVGDVIRTTLTPLTFSTPSFNGIQWDFLSDKYALTAIASRISNPGSSRRDEDTPAESMTDPTVLLGCRGTVQVGDFSKIGVTYVNAHIGSNVDDWVENSMKGQLSRGQNSGKVQTITIRLSDDSPEDGKGGAMLYWQELYIDGRKVDLGPSNPSIRGGIRRGGHYEANGVDQLYLIYDLSDYTYLDETGTLIDINWFRKIEFVLVLANDYKVEITSNLQVDAQGNEIFLPVVRAEGNIQDATNQKAIRFMYGLPTGTEILGATLDLNNVMGWDLRAEWDINRRYRRFPNLNPEIEDHALAQDHAVAYYVTAAKRAFPWYGYAEVFSIDPDYSTTAYLMGSWGKVYYDDERNYWFELVDDNDDQDRHPDWQRSKYNQRGLNDVTANEGIFPGLDENNDLISDFNQNQNYQPDYEEPFLQYGVDPPEFLFGLDLNHNGTIDRFENDEEADYPYKRGHRGYNVYGGVEMLRELKGTVGRLQEKLSATDWRSRSNYGLLTLQRSFARLGEVRVFNHLQWVQDTIPDDLVQWVQLSNTLGAMMPVKDPLMAPNTWVNSAYMDFRYTGVKGLQVWNKVKMDYYHQRSEDSWLGEHGYARVSRQVGVMNKADWRTVWWKGLVVHPKVKSMYLRREGYPGGQADREELWEMAFLVMQYGLFEGAWIEGGLQYTHFWDRRTHHDFDAKVFAVQLSNASSYLGYKLTSDLGFRVEIKDPKGQKRKTGSLAFLNVYAGVER